MLIDWTTEFDRWLDRLSDRAEAGAEAGAGQAIAQLARVNAAFEVLENLTAEPDQETPTLKRVRQSGKNAVWRIAHPYTPGVAIRLIVWFPPQRPGEVVVVLFGADKAAMGDVFYDSVGSRADAAINTYQLTTQLTTEAESEGGGAMMSEEPTTFVGTKAAAEKIAKIRAIRSVAEVTEQVRADMIEADHWYAENLAAIRKAAELTQVALAEQMGVPQSVVSRIERQHDMLLSTLTGYLIAAGEHPRVVITVNGQDVELDLTSLAAPA